MIPCLVFLYLDSPSRLVLLEKRIEFHALPRTGEFFKAANRKMGDYFGFRIGEVTHRETTGPELMLDRLPPSDGRDTAFTEQELDEYVASYLVEGWTHISTRPRSPGSQVSDDHRPAPLPESTNDA